MLTAVNPPDTLDSAKTLQVADLRDTAPTGATRHYVGGQQALGFRYLALAQYDGDSGVYLFYCDSGWNVVTDTYHADVAAATRQAEFEFKGVAFCPLGDWPC
jgi:hypothetical protein